MEGIRPCAVAVGVVAAACPAPAVPVWNWRGRGLWGAGGARDSAGEPGWPVSLRPHYWARGATSSAWERAPRFDGSADLQLSTCLTAL